MRLVSGLTLWVFTSSHLDPFTLLFLAIDHEKKTATEKLLDTTTAGTSTVTEIRKVDRRRVKSGKKCTKSRCFYFYKSALIFFSDNIFTSGFFYRQGLDLKRPFQTISDAFESRRPAGKT